MIEAMPLLRRMIDATILNAAAAAPVCMRDAAAFDALLMRVLAFYERELAAPENNPAAAEWLRSMLAARLLIYGCHGGMQ
jgi:hypothetical protein